MEVLQHQDRRAIRRGERVDGPDRRQRITTGGVGFGLAGDVQPGLDVPGGQLPLFVAAELGDFREGV